MKSALDCIPCFVSQTLNVVRMATDDEQTRVRILRAALRAASEADLTLPPVHFGRWLHRLVRDLTGKDDPYLSLKKESNRLALGLLPAWRERLQSLPNPRRAAVQLALAANVIDFGIKGNLKAEAIPAALEDSMNGPLIGDVDALFEEANRAPDILFLADNAGQLVFDRLLLELLPHHKITVAVKGGPAINDALRADAAAAGLDGWVEVMDTGSDGAGIALDACSPEFQQRFARASLILAKGQANYESLDACGRNILFLFKVKCPVVAQHIGHPLGSLVLHHGVPKATSRVVAAPPLEAGKPKPTTANNRKRKDKSIASMSDGTGPLGQGPVGKGLGPCGGGQRRGWGGGLGQGGQGRGRGFGRGGGQAGMLSQPAPAPSVPTENEPG